MQWPNGQIAKGLLERKMSTVVLDRQTREKLNGLNEQLELHDESGQLLGHFVPPADYKKMLYAWAEAQCPYSAEELEEMRKQPGVNTWAEVKQRLGMP
jgi:hypothetical protein